MFQNGITDVFPRECSLNGSMKWKKCIHSSAAYYGLKIVCFHEGHLHHISQFAYEISKMILITSIKMDGWIKLGIAFVQVSHLFVLLKCFIDSLSIE